MSKAQAFKAQGLISAGQVIRDLNLGINVGQKELLRKHGIPVEYATANGRGYTHWLTQKNAELLVAKLAPKPTLALVPPPPPAAAPIVAPASVQAPASSDYARALAAISANLFVLTEHLEQSEKRAVAQALAFGKFFTSSQAQLTSLHTRLGTLLVALGENDTE